MSDDFAPVRAIANELLARLSPAERARTLRTIARDTRQRQSARIARQEQPDGTAFEPRKEPLTKARARRGALRRKAMFRKLRLARSLAAGASPDEAWVGFAGSAARIATVHQEGLADAPARGQAKVRYARRVLLGLSDADRDRVLELLLGAVT